MIQKRNIYKLIIPKYLNENKKNKTLGQLKCDSA